MAFPAEPGKLLERIGEPVMDDLGKARVALGAVRTNLISEGDELRMEVEEIELGHSKSPFVSDERCPRLSTEGSGNAERGRRAASGGTDFLIRA
ncbi:hypothetical protein Agau_L100002 [Agrobacterium tumefaciens F2]|nr:hypothetical protein Agau_L100002 [Agrobacterium tumefaciens F2]